ncbi:DUF2309 domain-containing protein [Alicyclobacillus sp.]|uniref:DUF2309 domain-containing protein n=1 Tax=Alicyclobacillus sp. TaxID=61169 RepID=UPI0025C47F72|nr:DUF2309 domain-containing protein [Alicyclobacillus sp.]MCL6517628.1 DUF2309 domain-containing protein [Alicyclobacillus sp.]
MSTTEPTREAVRLRQPSGAVHPRPSHPDLREMVRRAADGIAPVWPIATFIARHPWPDLEVLPFSDAACRLHEAQGIRLHPSAAVIRDAARRGEIHPERLTARLERWLDGTPLPVPRAYAEQVNRALLWADPPSDVDPAALSLAEAAVAEGSVPDASDWTERPVSRRVGCGMDRRLDAHTIRWCKLFLDEGMAAWTLPGREEGLYTAWRRLSPLDPALSRAERRRLKDWPTSPDAALVHALRLLGIAQDRWEAYLRAHLLALPGWTGMLLWKSRESGLGAGLLTEYLALRLSLEWALCAELLSTARGADASGMSAADPGATVASGRGAREIAALLTTWFRLGGLTQDAWRDLGPTGRRRALAWLRRYIETDRWLLWLDAWEDTYRESLRAAMQGEVERGGSTAPVAQFLFCIDVRSDAFRRRLEASGPFATYGCAGFFNLPIRARGLDSAYAHPSCPAIVHPVVEIQEALFHPEAAAGSRDEAGGADAPAADVYRRRRNGVRLVGDLFKKTKQHLLAGLALPEMSGVWLGAHTLLRTIAPFAAGRWMKRAAEVAERKPETGLTLRRMDDHGPSGLPLGMAVEEMVDIAAGLLRSIGLTDFAPIVVVCGHESETVNNPHASALDCGACGGAAGAFNARAFAALCNLPEVRAGLAAQGIHIPPSTVFLAAEHITTTDELRWLEVPPLPPAATEALQAVQTVLPAVRRQVNAQRLAQLPGATGDGSVPEEEAAREAARRAVDWSEVRPEWGLAGNAAFVIGGRVRTARIPLDGRVFLHSYDWRLDPDGDRLAAIVAGPVTVAQWINLQYLASTVAPHVHGSGNKATQTVTGGIGVMQGNGSDLLAGLPWQSVAASDEALFHRPLRLLVVIEAPSEAVSRLLRRDSAFRRKVHNGWLRLSSMDPVTGEWTDWDPESLPRPLVRVG